MKCLVTSILFLVSSLLIMGCASMSKEECQSGNWKMYGSRDAQKGLPASVYAKHAEACVEHGIEPDKDAFMHGYKEGLKSFCTSESGYNFGLSGNTYKQTCSGPSSKGFLKAYRQGKEVYDLKSEISKIESEISSLESKLEGALDSSQRLDLVYKVRAKEKERGQLETELARLETRLAIERR